MSAGAVIPPENLQVALDDLEPLAAQWRRALDAADRALRAAVDTLPPQYLQKHHRALVEERRQTAVLLVTLARVHGIRSARFLARSAT